MKRNVKINSDSTKSKRVRAYPSSSFENVLPLAKAIFDHAGATHEMKRKTVFEKLNKAPESGPSRMLINDSSKYGITEGGCKAEMLKLTEDALLALNPHSGEGNALRAKFNMAIGTVPVFLTMYEKFKNGKLPAIEVMRDAISEITTEDKQRCIDIFISNLKFIGLLKVKDGAEFLLSYEDAVGNQKTRSTNGNGNDNLVEMVSTDYENTCFVISPIGETGTPIRKHADMILETLVAPAIQPLGLSIIRADKITKPGMISKQMVEHIVRSKLVIVDLSFHNPNVFYETAIRHFVKKPVVHLTRKEDQIPFDVGNFRTIFIDDSDMYELIAKIESYRAEIASAAREALAGSSFEDNPITSFLPNLNLIDQELTA